jgi:hypothetical protein
MSVYFAQSLDGGPIKIGCSVDVEHRLEQLQWHYGQPLALLKVLPGGREEERAIHERFAEHRLGRTEQFRPVTEIMESIGLPLLVGPNPDAVEPMPEKFHRPPQIVVKLGVDELAAAKDAAKRTSRTLLGFVRAALLEKISCVDNE